MSTDTCTPRPDPFAGYYNGLPSCPHLLARSDPTQWYQPRSGVDIGFPASKVIKPVDPSHPICRIWATRLGTDLLGTIDRHTDGISVSVDVMCIPYTEGEEGSSDAPILWIGVPPNTMSVEQAQNLVGECKGLLKSQEMMDVQIEVKESEVLQLGGTIMTLRDPDLIDRFEAGCAVARRMSTAVPLTISTPCRQNSFGTTAFYLGFQDSSHSQPGDIFLLTARHVICVTTITQSEQTGEPIPVHLSYHLFQSCLEELKELKEQREREYQRALIIAASSTSGDTSQILRARRNLENYPLDRRELEEMQNELDNGWSTEEQRNIGTVFYCPPEHQGQDQVQLQDQDISFSNDWALIKLDRTKLPSTIDISKLNQLDLSGRLPYHLARKHHMPLDTAEPLRLKGILSESDMQGSGSIAVVMRGATSGIRLGRSMPVFSMIKYQGRWEQYWAIGTIPEWMYESFSGEGDSGAGVVSRDGRMGGIVSCGSGENGRWGVRVDTTYVTPMFHILRRMRDVGLGDLSPL